METYLDYYNKHRDPMSIIHEDQEEYRLTVSDNGKIEVQDFSQLFDEAYNDTQNPSGDSQGTNTTDDFFEANYIYDQNFIRNPTVVSQLNQLGSGAFRGMFLDISINGSFNDESNKYARLSRLGKSDVVIESDQFEGYLDKQSPKLLVGWQTRYFMLKNRKLYYYKSKEKTDQVKGVINFDQVECTITHQPHKSRFDLRMSGVSRVFKFRCLNPDDYNIWVFRLMRNIERSQGYLLKLKIDEKISPLKSWRFDKIDEKDFLLQADIGDIILFRGTNFGSKITRGFTQSNFGKQIFYKHSNCIDHVGMILKFDQEQNEVFFLDATSTVGVQITRWSRFRLFKHTVYSSLVFRHLYCERDEPFLLALEQFIKTVVGNKFSITLKKLLFTRNTVRQQKIENYNNNTNYNEEQQNQKNPLENRMFFCSELITKAYKEIGLFKSDKASCRFYPHDFSKDGKIKNLGRDAKLGEEMVIEFDEQALQKEYEEFIKTTVQLQQT